MKKLLCFWLVLLLCIAIFPTTALTADQDYIKKEAILSSLYEANISAMREAIDLGLISCEELTAYYLDRISTYNKSYNCFITICDDALSVARARDEALADGKATGILFGIPIVIKDNIDLKGYHTTNGHKKNDDQIAKENARIVDYLLAEGAVIIAKANMSTDAQSARDSQSEVAGRTHNAYNKYLSASGSSGGSAVATSLNFTAAALGTDTNSSLRMPAAYAGCYSLRCTFGHISGNGVTTLNSSRDIPGAITRTLIDQTIMLDALTQNQYEYTKNLKSDALQGMRIGVIKELSYATTKSSDRKESNIDPEVSAAFANALEELKACGAQIVEVSMPKIFTLYNETTKTNNSAPKEELYKAFTNMLAEYNVSAVVFPSYLSTPLHAGTDENGKYWSVWDQTWINNCSILSPSASLPEMTVPIGIHSLGCGIGLEIAAPKDQEQLLLDIAYSYSLQYDHRTTPSGAPDTYASYSIGTLDKIIEDYKIYLSAQTTTPAETTTVPVTTTQSPIVTTPPTLESTTVPITTTTILTQESISTFQEATTVPQTTQVQSSPNESKFVGKWIYVILLAITFMIILSLIFVRKTSD